MDLALEPSCCLQAADAGPQQRSRTGLIIGKRVEDGPLHRITLILLLLGQLCSNGAEASRVVAVVRLEHLASYLGHPRPHYSPMPWLGSALQEQLQTAHRAACPRDEGVRRPEAHLFVGVASAVAVQKAGQASEKACTTHKVGIDGMQGADRQQREPRPEEKDGARYNCEYPCHDTHDVEIEDDIRYDSSDSTLPTLWFSQLQVVIQDGEP
mmetsp:Transcript_109371/g.244063  ORF Transcript_109371/g.244063 Transcript_109371/m.244063 type:complete len:211 (-) Transcript_109371:256-888(-)